MDIREDVSPMPMTITNNGIHEGLIMNSNGNNSNVHSIRAESKLTLCSSSLSPPPSAETGPTAGLQCLSNGGVTTMDAKQDAVRLLGRKPAKYRECLKNHAANLGGHATDGCGEFMPGGDEGTLEALQCAACGCHRNFHRREVEGGSSFTCDCGPFGNKHIEPLFAPMSLPALPAPPGALLHHHHHHHLQPPPQQMIMAFNPPPATDSDEFDGGFASPQSGQLRKRFRTKFTAEQKEQMWEFSEKLGWRIQKQDEEAVMQFCADVGVKRHVLKVWMHNNKNTLGKRLSATSGSGSVNIGGSIERLTDEDDDEDTRAP